MAPALLRLPHKILPLGLARCTTSCSTPNPSAIGRTSRVCQVSVIKNIHTAVVRPFIHTPNTPNGKQMPRGSLSRPSPNIPPLARGVREGGKPAKKRAITKLAECVARRRRAHGQVTRGMRVECCTRRSCRKNARSGQVERARGDARARIS